MDDTQAGLMPNLCATDIAVLSRSVLACDANLDEDCLAIVSGLDDLLDDAEDDNSSLHLDKTVPDELDFGDDIAFLDEVVFVDVDVAVHLAAINVAVLPPDLKTMAIVPDGSGLSRLKDLDKR